MGSAGTDLVFLDTGTESADRAEISRFTADLQPAGSVEVDESYVQSEGGVDGAVYAAALVRDPEDSSAEVRLLRGSAGATGTDTVWSVSDVERLVELRAPAIDPEGARAYLPTQQFAASAPPRSSG